MQLLTWLSKDEKTLSFVHSFCANDVDRIKKSSIKYYTQMAKKGERIVISHEQGIQTYNIYVYILKY